MPHPDPAVQVEEVIRIERALVDARKRAARAIREAREAKRISLRTAAKGVRLSPAALSKLERAHSWESKTAMRAVRFLARVA